MKTLFIAAMGISLLGNCYATNQPIRTPNAVDHDIATPPKNIIGRELVIKTDDAKKIQFDPSLNEDFDGAYINKGAIMYYYDVHSKSPDVISVPYDTKVLFDKDHWTRGNESGPYTYKKIDSTVARIDLNTLKDGKTTTIDQYFLFFNGSANGFGCYLHGKDLLGGMPFTLKIFKEIDVPETDEHTQSAELKKKQEELNRSKQIVAIPKSLDGYDLLLAGHDSKQIHFGMFSQSLYDCAFFDNGLITEYYENGKNSDNAQKVPHYETIEFSKKTWKRTSFIHIKFWTPSFVSFSSGKYSCQTMGKNILRIKLVTVQKGSTDWWEYLFLRFDTPDSGTAYFFWQDESLCGGIPFTLKKDSNDK